MATLIRLGYGEDVTDSSSLRVATDAVFREIALISRRVAARSRRTPQPLTVVEHSLLTFVNETPECRATDIARAFRLNRSTVSRQVGTLTDLGLVHVADEEAGPVRGRVLSLTEEGRRLLASSTEANRDAMNDRLAGWSEAEIRQFAAILHRFNAGDADPDGD